MRPLFILIFFALYSHLYAQKQFEISGTLTGFSDSAHVKVTCENITLDSCLLKNNHFSLKGKLEESPSSVYLSVSDGSVFKYAQLFIGNEKIKIQNSSKDFPFDIKTSGSKYDKERYAYAQIDKDLQQKRKELISKMMNLRENKQWNDSLQVTYWSRKEPKGLIVQIDEKSKENTASFIKQHINSYYALNLLVNYKTEFDDEHIHSLLKQLKAPFSNSIYAKSLANYLEYPDLKIGDQYLDFQAIDRQDKNIHFSSYFDGSYVLLDFSTLYCGFCLQAIPQLEELLSRNKQKLNIVTFYVDKNKAGFDGLAKKHSQSWNLLWDKEGRYSTTYAKYKVFGTPVFYLFDNKGKLIKKFDGFSEDMNQEIEELIH